MTSQVRANARTAEAALLAVRSDAARERDVVDVFRRLGHLDPERDGDCLVALVTGTRDATAAQRCLELAVAIRDALLLEGASAGVACELLATLRHDGPARVARERVVEWARRWDAQITVTGGFAGVRVDHRLEPVPGALLALHALTRSDVPVLPPLGRWVAPLGGRCWLEGGLLASVPRGALDVAELVRWGSSARRVLIVADAWRGKTYVARRLYAALSAAGGAVHATWLEDRVPAWPPRGFFDDPSQASRVWIVDAADEWLHRRERLDALDLTRADLLTLVFARKDDSYEALQSWLDPTEVVELLPLTREQLTELCDGDDETARRVTERARAIVGHAQAALSPAELLRLAHHDGSTLPELRIEIVRARCTEPRGAEPPPAHPAQAFEAAKRLAAAATFSGTAEVRFGAGTVGFFAAEAIDDALWDAARALERSRVLVPRGEAFRFAALHLAEDLAALAVVDALPTPDGASDDRARTLDEAGLRNLFSDGLGLRPDLSRVWERVREMRPDVERSRAAFDIDEAAALALYERLEARAAAHPKTASDLPFDLARALGGDRVKARAQAVLEEASPDPGRLELALVTALLCDWKDLAGPAARWAMASTLRLDAREYALWIALAGVRQGGDDLWESLGAVADALFAELDELPALEEPSPELPWGHDDRDPFDDPRVPQTETRISMLERVTHALLWADRIGALEAARRVPWGRGPGHARDEIAAELHTRLTVDEARAVLDALAQPVVPRHVRVLANRACELFLEHLPDPLDRDDERRLLAITERLHLASSSVQDRLFDIARQRAIVRRTIFERHTLATGQDAVALERSSEELAWLLGLAGRLPGEWPWSLVDGIAGLVLDLDERLHEVERARALLEARGLGHRVEALQTTRRERSEQLERWREADRARPARHPPVRIEHWLERLAEESIAASERLWRVGAILAGHTSKIAGRLDDLGVDAQRRFVESTRDALVEATPTAWPRTDVIPGAVVFEAAAFTWAATFERGAGWLTEELVARWLPTGLRGASRKEPLLVEVCLDVAPEATRRAVIAALGESATTIGFGETHYVPPRLLEQPAFRAAHEALLRQLAGSESVNAQRALPRLLASLFAHGEGWGAGRAGALVGELAGDRAELRRALTAQWFAHDPDGACDALVALASSADELAALLEPAVGRGFGGRRSLVERCSPSTNAALLRAGLALLEADEWTTRHEGWMSARKTAAAFLQELAWSTLMRHDELCEAVGVLRTSPYWREQLERVQNRDELSQEADLLPSRPPPTPAEVSALLAGSLRLVRDAHELALVVLRVLTTPPWTERELRLLVDDAGEPRRESAAQALLAVLLDAWQRGHPTAPRIAQEPLERGGDRPDFVVYADTPRGRVVVPVEVKRATNRSWKRDLEQQLVQRYLRDAGRTHGILFVVDTDAAAKALPRKARIAAEIERVAREHGVTVHLAYQARPASATRRR